MEEANALDVNAGDRRSCPRVQLEVEIGVASDTNFFMGFGEDLSDGGLFVATYDLLPVGTTLTASFTLPAEDEITVKARVVWQREPVDGGAPPGMGLAFDHIDDGDRETVLRFMKNREPLFYDV